VLCFAVGFFFSNNSSGQERGVNTTVNSVSKGLQVSSPIKLKETATDDYIGIYQKYISAIRGQDCPMYPSCSNFGLKTFREVSFAEAFILTSDRLLRCGHDRDNYALTLQGNHFKNLDYPYYDPPPQGLYYKSNVYYYPFADTLNDRQSPVRLVKSLILEGLYREALLELKRIQYTGVEYTEELFINELICFKAIGDFEKGIYAYELRCPISLKNNSEVLYQLASLHYNLGNYKISLDVAEKGLQTACSDFLKVKFKLLQSVIHANNYDWEKTRTVYKSLQFLPYPQNVREQKISLLNNTLPLPEKSPAKAALISVIPGLGYAYAGHKQTAISAFVVNSLLTYATYSSFKSKNYGMGVLTGVFNVSFYIGNVYGAVKSAKRYNQSRKKDLADKLNYNITL
jgi:putative component of membrane protein insertase Oxa1/YidC/SpoIIIJ protein YidD